MDQQFYDDQALRLSVLNDFPRHSAGILELAEALREIGGDRFFTAKLVKEFVDSDSPCPKPRGLKSKAFDMRGGTVMPVPGNRSGCQVCGGTGFSISERDVDSP